MLETYEKNSKKKLIATILAVMVIVGSTIFADHLRSNNSSANSTTTQSVATTATSTTNGGSNTNTTTTTSPTTTNSTAAATTAASPSSTSSYKDGTYTATEDYYVPHGDESIAVSLTISNSTITNATIQNSGNDRDSQQYQAGFAAEYKSYVIGKKISGLQLSVVSGASDTTQGFNDALTKIASEAQA